MPQLTKSIISLTRPNHSIDRARSTGSSHHQVPGQKLQKSGSAQPKQPHSTQLSGCPVRLCAWNRNYQKQSCYSLNQSHLARPGQVTSNRVCSAFCLQTKPSVWPTQLGSTSFWSNGLRMACFDNFLACFPDSAHQGFASLSSEQRMRQMCSVRVWI